MHTFTLRVFSGLTLALLLCCGCVNYSESRFTSYDAAMQLGQQIDDPTPIPIEDLPDDLPDAVAYAAVQCELSFLVHGKDAMLKLWAQVNRRDLKPDIMIYEPRRPGPTLGFAYSTRLAGRSSRPRATIQCYRLSPMTLGLKWDGNQVVTHVASETLVEVEIREGDTLLSANGHSVERPAMGPSPFESESLRLTGGQAVELVWIRPGVGRMSGTVTAREPQPGEG